MAFRICSRFRQTLHLSRAKRVSPKKTDMIPTERLIPDDLPRAAALLRAGAVVAFPTETVYGLGADATCAQAVVRIYEAKERPRFNPLIAHLPDAAAAMREGVFDADARAPDGSVCDVARAGLCTVALRVPDHPLARDLLAAAGRPIVAPSANRSGRV